MKQTREKRWNELVKVAEVADRSIFLSKLSDKVAKPAFSHLGSKGITSRVSANAQQTMTVAKEVAKSGLLTYLLHW